jgi:hypothetical protein
MRKKLKGQNFQVVFSCEKKRIKLPKNTISHRERGTKFPQGKRDYVFSCKFLECLIRNYKG